GNIGVSAPINVTVGSTTPPPPPSGDTIAPTVSITSPANGSTLTGTTVNINANATDNVGVTKVEFYVDNAGQSTDMTSPYSYALIVGKVAAGNHTIMVKAYDAAGNI